MSTIDDKLQAQFVVDFAKKIGEGPTIQLNLTAFQAWMLMEELQLVCMLPGNRGQGRAFSEEIARTIQADLANTPALRAVAERGWSPVYDISIPKTPGGVL
jgi:hypothetical protein